MFVLPVQVLNADGEIYLDDTFVFESSQTATAYQSHIKAQWDSPFTVSFGEVRGLTKVGEVEAWRRIANARQSESEKLVNTINEFSVTVNGLSKAA